MKNIAVLASGNGTNLQVLIDNIKRGTLKARLVLVVSDRKDAFALRRAEKAGVPAVYLNPKDFESREAFDRCILGFLKKTKVDLVILAGYMRILSPSFVKAFKNRILNIHPALLPAFPGMDSIKDAHAWGAKVTGVTVHFVDEKTDHGPIVAQGVVAIREGETLAALEARIHKVEHEIYTKAIAQVLSGRVKVVGRKVVAR
jgi:phosphoribosylglycinamide formyltransferase-1